MDESFERAMEPQPVKRKRSSILKPPEKRASRDSRTVSFNDRYVYKELHQDGTCEITNLFLREDLDVVTNQTINSSMSMDQGSISIDCISSVGDDTVIDVETSQEIEEQEQNHDQDLEEQEQSESHERTLNNSSHMDLTLISQFMNTMPKINSIELPTASLNYETSTLYDKEMSLTSDITTISSLDSYSMADKTIEAGPDISIPGSIKDRSSAESSNDSTLVGAKNGSTTMNNCSIGRISDISSFNTTKGDLPNETFYGAFHDSNNMSLQSRTSGLDSMIHNIEALNECVQKVEQATEENLKRLDEEIEEILKFYRHVVNKDNKYEFAIRIFGLRHSLWLILKVNPDTYPNEKLNLRFAVNKRDRHLYPFPEFSEAVRRCTKENRPGYLTKIVINAQKFRRFLKASGFRKPNKVD